MNFILLTVPGYGPSDFLMALGGVVGIACGAGLVLFGAAYALKCWAFRR